MHDAARRAAVDALEEAVAAGRTPGGVLAAGWGPDLELLAAAGRADTGPSERLTTTTTLFDLASLTKVVVTLPIILALAADCKVSLETPVVEVLPEFAAPGPGGSSVPPGLAQDRPKVRLRHLLTHSSGLPAQRRYWQLGLAADELLYRLVSEPLEDRPGVAVRYSDIGFVVLGLVAEAVGGHRLDRLFSEVVAGPLGLTSSGYGPRSEPDVAATERGEQGLARVGTVHDETAAALGFPVGHAGLFAPASDLAAYLGAWTAPQEGWIPAKLRAEATRDQTAGLGGHRGYGWVTRHDAHDQLGEAWPETGIFHSGFTGTSLAFDPASTRWVVLLTNDVHFGRDRGQINPLRRAVHTALAP